VNNQVRKRPALVLPGLAAKATKPVTQQLPGGGFFDNLLQPGCAEELFGQLAGIFRDDPPVDCGRTNGRTAGLSCAYGERYAQEVFSPAAVVQTLELAKGFWDSSPSASLLQLPLPRDVKLVIVGDTHGQLEDVLWVFFKYGVPSKTTWYLFNGDIVDRGGHALEIILLLFAFKRELPDSVHILRGNHEDANCVIQFGFKSELESKFPNHLTEVWNACTSVVFPLLPIAAVVSDAMMQQRFFVVHGGIPVGIEGQQGPITLDGGLTRIARQRSTVQKTQDLDYDGHVLYNFLWADPAESLEEQTATRSRAIKFLEADTREFCEHNRVEFVVRSHEVPRNLRGVMASHSGLCYTVFSASNYAGSVGNRGGVLTCSGSPLALHASEHMAPPWGELAVLITRGLASADGERSSAVRAWEERFGIVDRPAEGGGFGIYDTILWFLGLEGEPESAASVPMGAGAKAAAAQQQMQFVIERLVEHKDELFEGFSEADPGCSGVLPRSAWAHTMLTSLGPHSEGVLTPSLLDELHEAWNLPDPVPYVRFLHRFQIRDDPSDGSVLVDRIQVVSQLQATLVDFSCLNLERLLDPNGDKDVTWQEFAAFLPRFHIQVPPWQAAALYETMSGIVDQRPITLDSAIMCLALVSQDPPLLSDWSETVEEAGREILASGKTLAGAFRSWDHDGDGFLSRVELEEGLRSLPVAQSITNAQARACIEKIDAMGISNARVSVFEFVRALSPRAMTLALQGSLIKEALKRVWVCRPALLAALAQSDPDTRNVVSIEVFRRSVYEVNLQLEQMGLLQLTDIQVMVICEIAANRGQEVRYDHFVRGLHVEDTKASRPPVDAR